MSLSYTLRESLSGFTRTKLSSTISIITICISLLLLGVFAVITIHASRFIETIRNRVELEAFIQEPVTAEEIDDIARAIVSFDGVEKAVFISKEEAAQIFKQEFGEDITTVLDFNPLPPSFKISLQPGARTAAGAQALYERLRGLKGIEDVVYRRALLELIDQRAEAVNRVTLGLGILISLSAILLVSNTIRLAIYAKRKLIRTMELVGATWSFIRLPFLLEGGIQGLLGGILASGILYLVIEHGIRFASAELAGYAHMDTLFYLLVVAAGTVLGLLGSLISVLRFIRPARAS
jgi:cell division transport system permease protein